MLADASTAERGVLGAIGYQRNIATLHTDERMLPRNRRATRELELRDRRRTRRHHGHLLDEPTAVDRDSTALARDAERSHEIDPRMRLAEFQYDHPVFDVPAMAAQHRRAEIQGRRGIYFAGAYWGYGFHEDGVQSALEVVRLLESRR